MEEENEMYCPTCAAENSEQTKFCRGCGADLSMVHLAATGGISSTLMREVARFDESLKRENKFNIRRDLLNIIFGLMIIALQIFVIGISLSVIGLVPLLIACLMIGVGLGGTQKYREGISSAARRGELPSAKETNELAPSNPVLREHQGSVTEETTRLLQENGERKRLE